MLASLVAFALVASQQQAPDLTKSITYEANALPSRKVMADLTGLSGYHLEASNEVLNDRLILRFENATLGDVLKKLALITYGKWETADGGLRLRRDPALVTQNEKDCRARALETVNRTFKSYRKRLAKEQAFDADQARDLARSMSRWNKTMQQSGGFNQSIWQQQERIQKNLPLGRAMDRVLLSLAPDLLVDVPPRSKVVLSTEPTSIEYALPEGALGAINKLVEEQAVWADAAQRYMAQVAGDQNMMYFEGMSKKDFRRATKALLSITRYSRSFNLNVELILADAKGNILGRSSSGLYEGYQDPDDAPAVVTPPNPPKELPTIPLPPLAQEASALFNFDDPMQNDKSINASNALRNALAHPTLFDPQALVYGQGLLAMAREHHENLAVLGDDQILAMTGVFVKNKAFNQNSARAKDLSYLPQEVSIDGGWYTCRPKNLGEYSSNQVDRPALEVLLNDLNQNGRMSVELLANFATLTDGDSPQQIVGTLANGLVPGAGQLVNQNDWDTLRFYGSLEPEQRASAAKQGFARLTQAQMALANRLIYGLYSRLNVEMAPAMAASFSADGGEVQDFAGSWNKLDREPTQALPNGIPFNSFFTITQETGSVILAEMQYGQWYQGLQMQEPESLAWMIYQTAHPMGGDSWKVLSLQAANKHQINIKFSLTPKVTQDMTLIECKPRGKKAKDANGLPDDMRDRLAKQVAEVAKNMQNADFSVYTNGTNTGSTQP
jgi:hypothetical protein